jgi:hypothetical protein
MARVLDVAEEFLDLGGHFELVLRDPLGRVSIGLLEAAGAVRETPQAFARSRIARLGRTPRSAAASTTSTVRRGMRLRIQSNSSWGLPTTRAVVRRPRSHAIATGKRNSL